MCPTVQFLSMLKPSKNFKKIKNMLKNLKIRKKVNFDH